MEKFGLRISPFLFSMITLLLFTLCKKDESVISPSFSQSNIPPPGSISGKWSVIAHEKRGEKLVYLNPLDTINIEFNDDLFLEGQSYGLCGNSYLGKYYLYSYNHIKIDSLTSTEMACQSSFYWQFYHFLKEVNIFGIDTMLYLYNEPITERLLLKHQNQP
jgi:heat shock protein HslJ